MKKLITLSITAILFTLAICFTANAESGKVLLDQTFEDGSSPFSSVIGSVEIVEEKGTKNCQDHTKRRILFERGY